MASSGNHGSMEIVEPQLTVLHENHGPTAVMGFCDRSDAKDRVGASWAPIAERHCAERLHMHIVLMTDQRNQPAISLRSTYPDNT